MKIIAIEEFKKSKYRITLEDESSLVVYRGRIRKDTTELTEQELDGLKQEMIMVGKRYAMHLLVKKDYARGELAAKLEKEGYEGEIEEAIFSYLDSFHYLDDVRYAGMLIRGRKEQKSQREIRHLLKKKGISEEDIELAMENCYYMEEAEEGALPEEAAIKRQMVKYHVTEETLEKMDYLEKQKLAAKLYRKGFAQDNIRKMLRL